MPLLFTAIFLWTAIGVAPGLAAHASTLAVDLLRQQPCTVVFYRLNKHFIQVTTMRVPNQYISCSILSMAILHSPSWVAERPRSKIEWKRVSPLQIWVEPDLQYKRLFNLSCGAPDLECLPSKGYCPAVSTVHTSAVPNPNWRNWRVKIPFVQSTSPGEVTLLMSAVQKYPFNCRWWYGGGWGIYTCTYAPNNTILYFNLCFSLRLYTYRMNFL